MLRNWFHFKIHRIDSHLLSFNSRFSSQEVKPLKDIKVNQHLVENEGQECVDISSENSDKSKSIIKSLNETELKEIQESIKKPEEYDALFEYMSSEAKQYNQNTDYGSSARKGLSTNLYVVLHHKWDLSITGFKRRFKYYIGLREKYNQRYIPQRHGILGPELASAHFITYRGGRVKFRHSPNVWLTDVQQFPNKYDKRYQLLAIDASDIKLRYEAFDNLSMLQTLQELNLSNNYLLDDWSCDKLARLFRNSTTLSTLDLSNNHLITSRGIETLHRIKSLRKLIITGTKAAQFPFIELLIILFNDVNPNCEIIV